MQHKNLFHRSVALHIGAHKTATTHLQQSIEANQEKLEASGVQYYGPNDLRPESQSLIELFDLRVKGKTPQPQRGRAEQRELMIKDGHRLLFSDENFCGTLQRTVGVLPMPLYPKAPERVSALAEAIDLGPIEVYLSIRNPTDFLVSSYSQAVLGGATLPFAEFVKNNPATGIYWPGLIARLKSATGVKSITIWRYEDYRDLFHQVTALMTGVPGAVLPIEGRSHRGLSQRAVDEVMRLATKPKQKGLGQAARSEFPVSDENPPFRPLSDEEHAQARADYRVQIEQIAGLDGVRLLRP